MVDQWIQSDVAGGKVDGSGASVIYGHNSGVTILGWKVTLNLGLWEGVS